jgi:maltose O-acetyltransferase
MFPGVEIGDSCVIGAGALVAENVPNNMMCVGNPGRIIPISENAGKILGNDL